VALAWTGVALYSVAAVLFGVAVIFGRERLLKVAIAVAALGLLPHGAAVIVRWVAVGHGPYLARYEVLVSNAWVAMAVLVAVIWRRPAWAPVALAVLPLSVLSVASGLFANPQASEMPPSVRSIWLIIHVIFAKVAAAAFLMSLGASVALLLRLRASPPAWTQRMPSVAALDAFSVRSVGFGFMFWTVTIAAGAVWGHQLWGRYWGWDPIETWSLVSWLVYGSFLHARLFFKLRPAQTAWLSVASFVVFVLALIILPFFIQSLHSAYFT
jgi:cytochrome c-type biogenesis protein CcsB